MNTDRADDFLDQQSGRVMLDATGSGGSMDMLNYGVFGKIARRIIGGESGGAARPTKDLVREGIEAKPKGDVLSPDEAEELARVADELQPPADSVTPPVQTAEPTPAPIPVDQAAPQQNPLDAAGVSVDPDQFAADVAAKDAEELERRTWERNINLDYVDQPQDIGGILEVNAAQLPTAARESFAEIETGAKTVDMREVLTGPVDANLNSRQMLAGREMLVTMSDQLKDLTNKILSGKATTEDKANFDKLQKQTVMLQKFMQGKIREAGRTLNSMKIVARAVNSRDLGAITEMTAGDNVMLQAKILQEKFSDETITAGEAIDAIDQMGPINKRIAALANYWTASILTSPKTQIVNATSNATFQLMDTMAVKPLAAAVSPLRRRITGDTDGTEMIEVGAEMVSFVQGFRDALMMAGRVFKEGMIDNQGEYVSTFGGRKIDEITRDEMRLAEALMVEKVPVLSYLTNMYQRGVEAASYGGLTMGDEFFKAMAYRKSLYGQVVRQAKQEGLSGDEAAARADELLTDVSFDMNKLALEEAERLTFTNETGGILGMMSDSVQQWTQAVPALRFIAPFIKTPVSLLDRTIKMTPLAPLQQEFRDTIAKGGPEADVALGQLAFGTLVFTAAAVMYHNGSITGSGPDNPAQRAAYDRLGVQPNSLRIGDTQVSYNRGIDPMGMAVGAMANMLDMVSYAEDEATAMDYTAGVIFAIAKYFKDSTYMQGFAEILMVVDGNRSAEKYFSRQLASLVPSIFRDVESLMRGSEQGPGVVYPGADFWETFNAYLDQRLPGNVGMDLPPRRYWDAEVVVAGGGEAVYIYNSLSPIRINHLKADAASDRMAANGIRVTPPSSSITLDTTTRTKVDLMKLDNGAELYDRLIVLVGKARRKRMDKLVSKRAFNRLDSGPGEDQAMEIEKELQLGLKDGKEQFLREMLDNPPSAEKYGPDALLFEKRTLRNLLRNMARDNLTEEETQTLRRAETKGLGSRDQELWTPNID